MTRNRGTEIACTTPAGAVLTAGRRRIWLLFIAALTALAATITALMITAIPPQSSERGAGQCTVFGPGPVNNGKAVIAAGAATGVPEEVIVAGLAAAMQETNLLNLANPAVPESLTAANDGLAADHQSVGILQQHTNWGSAEDRMSPAGAAEKFFVATRAVEGWEAMPAAELAGIVQRSAWPGIYADEVPAARQFYRDHIGEVMATQCPGAHP